MTFRIFSLGLMAATCLAGPAFSADTTADAAAALLKSMTSWMPEKLAASGALAVTPEGDHFRVRADFSRLDAALAPLKIDLALKGVIDYMVYPPSGAEGLMAVKREAAPIDITGNWGKGAEKGNISYKVDGAAYDGQFDPAIPYFRSVTAHSAGQHIVINNGPQKTDVTAGRSDQSQSSNRNADRSLDFSGTGSVANLVETVSGPGPVAVALTMDKFGYDVSMKGLKAAELVAIYDFAAQHWNDKALVAKDTLALAGLVGKALPVMTGVEEKIDINGFAVSGPGFGVKLAKLSYGVGTSGFTDNAEAHFGLGFSDPDISGVPQMVAYGDLVPKEFTMNMSVPGLNFATLFNSFMKQADFSKAEPLTREQSEALGRLFVKDGHVNIAVPVLTARNPLYDISVTGQFSVNTVDQPTRASADFDITARNLDTTIKGIQQLGQTIPQLNSAAFGLMMANGMAKKDADGASHWKIEVSEDGVTKVNGQVMPH
nr:hypothetical protein [uncultured Gellertiella sp.]